MRLALERGFTPTMPDFNALMNPAQIGQGVTNNIFAGWQFARGAEAQNALAKYAENPSMETARGVAPHDPRSSIQLQGMEEQRMAREQAAQREAQERQMLGAALQGDPQARQALAYTNADWFMKLEDRGKAAVSQTMETIAQQAFSILQLPEEQRGPALQQALQGLQQQGVDVSQFQLSGNATQDLMSALAVAGKLDEWEQFSQPRYQAVGEAGLAGFQFGQPIQQGGMPQNFAPPPQNMPRVTSPSEAMNLPPGTQFIDPQGQVRVVPGGTAGNGGGSFPGN